MSSILVSRFLISLRQADASNVPITTGDRFTQLSAPNFCIPTIQSAVGNIGEPFVFEAYEVQHEELQALNEEVMI